MFLRDPSISWRTHRPPSTPTGPPTSRKTRSSPCAPSSCGSRFLTLTNTVKQVSGVEGNLSSRPAYLMLLAVFGIVSQLKHDAATGSDNESSVVFWYALIATCSWPSLPLSAWKSPKYKIITKRNCPPRRARGRPLRYRRQPLRRPAPPLSGRRGWRLMYRLKIRTRGHA